MRHAVVTAGPRKDEQIIAIASGPAARAAAPAWGITVPRLPPPWFSSTRMSRRVRDRITLRLFPTNSEERTRFRLEGTLPTALPAFALHQLVSPLVYWSGRPMHAVLSAGGSACWLEVWAAALAGAPERLVTVEFEVTEGPDDAG